MTTRRPVLAAALYALFRGNGRIAETTDLAVALDISESTARRWTNGETDFGVTDADIICEAFPSAAEALLGALVSRHGFRLDRPVPDADTSAATPRSLTTAALTLNKDAGELGASVLQAIEDGAVTPRELGDIEAQATELVRHATELLVSVRVRQAELARAGNRRRGR